MEYYYNFAMVLVYYCRILPVVILARSTYVHAALSRQYFFILQKVIYDGVYFKFAIRYVEVVLKKWLFFIRLLIP